MLHSILMKLVNEDPETALHILVNREAFSTEECSVLFTFIHPSWETSRYEWSALWCVRTTAVQWTEQVCYPECQNADADFSCSCSVKEISAAGFNLREVKVSGNLRFGSNVCILESKTVAEESRRALYFCVELLDTVVLWSQRITLPMPRQELQVAISNLVCHSEMESTKGQWFLHQWWMVTKTLFLGAWGGLCGGIPGDCCNDQTQLCKRWSHRRGKRREQLGREAII